LFLLPKPDQQLVFFVVSLDPPIKQGQTRHPHLVMAFPKEDTLDVTLDLTGETLEKYKEKFPELNLEMKGASYDIVSRVFKILTGKKITVPNTFKSSVDAFAIRCSLKANEGFLYPLERSFFFVHKPPTHIRFEEIDTVEFARVNTTSSSTSTRTFDILMTLKSGSLMQFTGIQRQEYSSLFNFITAKQLKIKAGKNVVEFNKAEEEEKGEDDEEEEEDEDFVADEEDDDVPEEYDEEYEHPVEEKDADKNSNKTEKDKHEKHEKKHKKEKSEKHHHHSKTEKRKHEKSDSDNEPVKRKKKVDKKQKQRGGG